MRLRPRYSLLTLLVFTALVAGGAKLWHGPHHVVLHDPLTREDNRLVQPIAHDWINHFDSHALKFRHEAEYIRAGQYARTLALRLIPQQEMTIYRFDTRDTDGRIELVYPYYQETWGYMLQGGMGIQIRSSERVVCLMHSGRLPAVKSYNVHPPGGAAPTLGLDPKLLESIPKSSKLEIVYKPNLLYALTDQGQIYELELLEYRGVRLRPVTIGEIHDAELKEQITAELERLPRSR